MKTKKIILPEGWEIDNVKDNEIILKESKNELPKTWFDCLSKYKGDLEYIDNKANIHCHESNGFIQEYDKNFLPKGLGKPMLAFCQLLICREIYRQGWKPDWTDHKNKYTISYLTDMKITPTINEIESKVLSFQSRKIRDEFLENFHDLIKEAKELI